MTLTGQQNHYNVKFLKGYGFSIKVKDSKIVLKNTYDPFKEPEVEEWFVNNMSYEKIECKKGLEKILKPGSKLPACVKPDTLKILLNRGWTLN